MHLVFATSIVPDGAAGSGGRGPIQAPASGEGEAGGGEGGELAAVHGAPWVHATRVRRSPRLPGFVGHRKSGDPDAGELQPFGARADRISSARSPAARGSASGEPMNGSQFRS